jgi:hypothetical protein
MLAQLDIWSDYLSALILSIGINMIIKMKELTKNILAFRSYYPKGKNFIVSYDISESFKRKYQDLDLYFVNVEQLINKI